MTDKFELTTEQLLKLLETRGQAEGVKPADVDVSKDPEVKALADKLADQDKNLTELGKSIETVLEALKHLPAAKDGGVIAPDDEDGREGVKSLADFLMAVKNKNVARLKTVYKTAMSEDSGATGGYLVPAEIGAPIMARAREFSVLRQAGATIVPMARREVDFPKLNIEDAPSAGDTAFAGGVAASWTSEGGTLTETEPTFEQITLVAHKLAGYSLVSSELNEDSPEALANLLTLLFGRAVGVKENYAFFRGNGVGQPKGILESGALVSATRSATSTVALADLAQMMSDFLPDSWATGAWFINPEAIDQLIQLVTNPITWLQNAREGLPVTILGRPLYVTGALPSLNTAGDILLVDPTYYLIGDKGQLSIAFSEHYKFANDQVAWRFTHRVDGQPWVDSSITLENASTVVSPFVALAAG